MTTKRISLDENDFKTLVSGGVVEQDGVKIILKDIGFEKMDEIVLDVASSRVPYFEEVTEIDPKLFSEGAISLSASGYLDSH